MNLTGYGNNPSLVALIQNVGKALAEDEPGLLRPKEANVEDLPAYERLYPGKGPGGSPVATTA